MTKGYIPLFIMILLTFAGHICFKRFSLFFHGREKISETLYQFLHPAFLGGFLLIAAAPLFYFRALESIDLSAAYSLTALNQIAVPAAGILIFRENCSWKKIAGIILVFAGILVWNL